MIQLTFSLWWLLAPIVLLMLVVLVASGGELVGCVPLLGLLILFLIVLAWLVGHFFFHACA